MWLLSDLKKTSAVLCFYLVVCYFFPICRHLCKRVCEKQQTDHIGVGCVTFCVLNVPLTSAPSDTPFARRDTRETARTTMSASAMRPCAWLYVTCWMGRCPVQKPCGEFILDCWLQNKSLRLETLKVDWCRDESMFHGIYCLDPATILQKVFKRLEAFYILLLQPEFKMDYILILCHWSTHTTP
jgi:hypothetical protein